MQAALHTWAGAVLGRPLLGAGISLVLFGETPVRMGVQGPLNLNSVWRKQPGLVGALQHPLPTEEQKSLPTPTLASWVTLAKALHLFVH